MAGIKTWTDENTELLKSLWARGWTCAQIAAELGSITRNAVIGKIHRLGISNVAPNKPHTPPRSPEEREARRLKALEQRRENRRNARPLFTYSRPVRPAVCEVMDPLGIKLADLEAHHCRWPSGSGPYSFCGHVKFHGSYCAPHYFGSVGQGTASERAADRVAA